jgi:hypothetical protein
MFFKTLHFKNTLLILLLTLLLLPNFSFLQAENKIEPPETLEAAGQLGKEMVQKTGEKLPGILERIWTEEAMPVWNKMWGWSKELWQKTVWPWIKSFFEKKVKPSLKEELEKEKEEIKKEAPEIGRSLWERLKDLLD